MLYQESKGRTEGLTTSDTLDASVSALAFASYIY
jgi:hypothetical protein